MTDSNRIYEVALKILKRKDGCTLHLNDNSDLILMNVYTCQPEFLFTFDAMVSKGITFPYNDAHYPSRLVDAFEAKLKEILSEKRVEICKNLEKYMDDASNIQPAPPDGRYM